MYGAHYCTVFVLGSILWVLVVHCQDGIVILRRRQLRRTISRSPMIGCNHCVAFSMNYCSSTLSIYIVPQLLHVLLLLLHVGVLKSLMETRSGNVDRAKFGTVIAFGWFKIVCRGL